MNPVSSLVCQIVINFISALKERTAKNVSLIISFHFTSKKVSSNWYFVHCYPLCLDKIYVIEEKNQLKPSGAFNFTVFEVAKTALWTFTTVEGK